VLILYGNISVAESDRHRRAMMTSERKVAVSPEFMTSKSTAQLFVKPLFWPPTYHATSRQKNAQTNGFFEELWPLLFVQKLSGIFPYHVTPTGKFL
jgi:hypothetical protein